jgi:hypothetical protein
MFRNCGKQEEFKEISCYQDKLCKIEWDYQPSENGYASWVQETFLRIPTFDEIEEMIINYFDSQTHNNIIYGFSWEGRNGEVITPKLTSENQFNYKAAYDLAVQTEGRSLPFRIKYGEVTDPLYYDFDDLEEFTDFYVKCINHINDCLQEGWTKKDGIDWSKYEI